MQDDDNFVPPKERQREHRAIKMQQPELIMQSLGSTGTSLLVGNTCVSFGEESCERGFLVHQHMQRKEEGL